MTPHGFSHLYELFVTFTLAYIIIDELTENPFVSLITEKILKKYTILDDSYILVKNRINGHKVSIASIEKLESQDQVVSKGIPIAKSNLTSIENRLEQFFKKIKKKIRRNYTTKIFVFLNCYLLLYGLAMLFIGGLYEEVPVGITPSKNLDNLNLDNSLFLFFIGSLSFLICGWLNDRKVEEKNTGEILDSGDDTEDDNKQKQKSFIIENGYYIAGGWFIILTILSIFTYFCSWRFFSYIFNFEINHVHNILIICTVFLPLSNFVVYFFKANRRANRCLPDLRSKASAKRDELLNELEDGVENFIKACNWIKGENIKIVQKD